MSGGRYSQQAKSTSSNNKRAYMRVYRRSSHECVPLFRNNTKHVSRTCQSRLQSRRKTFSYYLRCFKCTTRPMRECALVEGDILSKQKSTNSNNTRAAYMRVSIDGVLHACVPLRLYLMLHMVDTTFDNET